MRAADARRRDADPETIRRQPLHRLDLRTAATNHIRRPAATAGRPGPREPAEHALLLRHRRAAARRVRHGALMGRGSVDLRLFRARHPRGSGLERGAAGVAPARPAKGQGRGVPGQDLLDDVHAAAQAAWTSAGLIPQSAPRKPDARIGLNSMSLGGLHHLLVACRGRPDMCGAGVPVADLIEVLGGHGGSARR